MLASRARAPTVGLLTQSACGCLHRRVLQIPVRRLCDKRPPPRAFESFFPRTKRGAEASDSAASREGARSRKSTDPKEESKLNSSAGEKSKSDSSGGGGGGGATPTPTTNQMILAAVGSSAALLLFALGSESAGGKRTHEISMQHFFTNILAQVTFYAI